MINNPLRIFDIVASFEGGYSADPKDPASAIVAPNTKGLDKRFRNKDIHTNAGITFQCYIELYGDNMVKQNPSTASSELVRRFVNMRKTERMAVWLEFWYGVKGDDFEQGISDYLAHFSWGSGRNRAVIEFQKAINMQAEKDIIVDGIIGNQTITAYKSCNKKKLLLDLHNNRKNFLEKLPNSKYYVGWFTAIEKLYNDCEKYVK